MGTPFTVTSLADNKKGDPIVIGSLRDALNTPGRDITFAVTGTIALQQELNVKGANVTINADSAPGPVYLKTFPLGINNVAHGAHDVRVQGLRFRASTGDGITITQGAFNVAIVHCSVQGASDGAIDITHDCKDVVVQFCLIAQNQVTNPPHNYLSLVKYGCSRITYHHNLIFGGQDRNPHIAWDDPTAPLPLPTDTTAEIYNNVIWDYIDIGVHVSDHARVNMYNNLFKSNSAKEAKDALRIEPGSGGLVWAKNNVWYQGAGADIDALSTEAQSFPTVTSHLTQTGCETRKRVHALVGPKIRDDLEHSYIRQVFVKSPPC